MLTPNPSSQPVYRQEDVQEILQLAIARKMDRQEFSQEQLLEIAEELEIDKDTLAKSQIEWLEKRQILQKRQEFDLYRRATLKHKLVRYAIVNGFLVSLNLLSAGVLSWSLYILLIWGMKVSLDIWKTYQQSGEAYETAFERWRLKNDVKQSLTNIWQKIKQFLQN